jgi:hypothetical protein
MKIQQKNIFVPIKITIENFEEACGILEAVKFAISEPNFNCSQIERDTCLALINKLEKIIEPLES